MQEADRRLVAALQARALIDDVGMDNVTIHLDTYHMNIEENSMEAAVKDAGDKLGWELAHGTSCHSACSLCRLKHITQCNCTQGCLCRTGSLLRHRLWSSKSSAS